MPIVTGERAWQSLATSEAPLVVAVDFSAPGRREAGFSDLVAQLGTGWAV